MGRELWGEGGLLDYLKAEEVDVGLTSHSGGGMES